MESLTSGAKSVRRKSSKAGRDYGQQQDGICYANVLGTCMVRCAENIPGAMNLLRKYLKNLPKSSALSWPLSCKEGLKWNRQSFQCHTNTQTKCTNGASKSCLLCRVVTWKEDDPADEIAGAALKWGRHEKSQTWGIPVNTETLNDNLHWLLDSGQGETLLPYTQREDWPSAWVISWGKTFNNGHNTGFFWNLLHEQHPQHRLGPCNMVADMPQPGNISQSQHQHWWGNITPILANNHLYQQLIGQHELTAFLFMLC